MICPRCNVEMNKGFQTRPKKVDNFEQVIHDFYSELLAHQEPLGEQFEAVLFNNLWDLYED